MWRYFRSRRQRVQEIQTSNVTEEHEEEEDLVREATYSDYMPSKLKLGERHPDAVVETSSLSSVPPPDVWYTLSIPKRRIQTGHLSALQLEAIVYACQQHEKVLQDDTRAGFLIGDGAGVGKGRILAGIIYENYILGRKKAIWLSVSNDLKYDAERDLMDIGAPHIQVHALNKFKYNKISSKVNGNVTEGVVFATYSSLIGESHSSKAQRSTRLDQLVEWCGEDFEGCIVFDECHKAKNLCPAGPTKPTKTGLAVLSLQMRLPKARIVYASATGASEPRNMAYMTRLALWGEGTAFRAFSDFISTVEKRGVAAMEMVAMEMKLRGMYIARQLSFAGVTFKIEEIKLNQDFVDMYDNSVELWVDAFAKFEKASKIMKLETTTTRSMWSQFWAAHQRFFKYLCIASKVKQTVQITKQAVKDGKCVVIGLQSTGEARTLDQLEEAGGELNDFVSTARGVFEALMEKSFPAPNVEEGSENEDEPTTTEGSSVSSPETNSSKRSRRKPVRQGSRSSKRVKLDLDDDVMIDPAGDYTFHPFSDESDTETSLECSDLEPPPDLEDSDYDSPLEKKKRGSKAVSKVKSEKMKATPKSKSRSAKKKNYKAPTREAFEQTLSLKKSLLDALEKIGDSLPPNTLDQLIDELGGPDEVAEMTGRRGRVVSQEDGKIQYESRSEEDVA